MSANPMICRVWGVVYSKHTCFCAIALAVKQHGADTYGLQRILHIQVWSCQHADACKVLY